MQRRCKLQSTKQGGASMAILQTKHTMAAINKIKNELARFMKIVRVGSMLFFAVYYAYLIFTNLSSTAHLLVYITLFSLVIGSFIVEVSLKTTDQDTRKGKRIKLELRRKIGNISKVLKYAAKSVTIGLALHAALTNPTSEWDVIFDLVSCGILVVSILSEVVTGIINRYFDYLKVGFEMDIDDSYLSRFVRGKQQRKVIQMERQLHQAKGENIYTTEEERIANLLIEEANRMQAENTLRLGRQIEERELELTRFYGKNLSKKQKNTLKDKYQSWVEQALLQLELPQKVTKQLFVAQQFVGNLAPEKRTTEQLDTLITLVDSYIDGNYTNIQPAAIAQALATINYFVATQQGETTHCVPVDVAYIVDLCLKNIKKDIKTFVDWQIATQQ